MLVNADRQALRRRGRRLPQLHLREVRPRGAGAAGPVRLAGVRPEDQAPAARRIPHPPDHQGDRQHASRSSRRSSKASTPQEFLKTVAEWNKAVQHDIPFNPNVKDGRCTQGLAINKSNWANTLDTPPYEGYAVTCGITFTFGGLRVNTDCEVLEHRLPADPRALRRGRAGRRHLLLQLSGRLGAVLRRGVRQDRRHVGRTGEGELMHCTRRHGRAIVAGRSTSRWRSIA